MRLGILGGTFDPVHYGHLVLAECCREHCRLDRVLFLPAAVPPHKLAYEVTAAANRVEMLKLAIGGHPQFEVSTYEVNRGGVNYTFETLAALQSEYPDAELFFLLGSDSLNDLPQWREPRRICELATLAVAQRAGSPEPNWQALAGLVSPQRLEECRGCQTTMPQIGSSSNDLRRRVAEGRSIRYQTPRAVEKYIETHGLYRQISAKRLAHPKAHPKGSGGGFVFGALGGWGVAQQRSRHEIDSRPRYAAAPGTITLLLASDKGLHPLRRTRMPAKRAESSGQSPRSLPRRRALKALAGLGIGTLAFQRAVAAQVAKAGKVTPEMIRDAEWIAGLELSDADRASTARSVERAVGSLQAMREVKLENSVPPAVQFQPAPWLPPARDGRRGTVEPTEAAAPVRPMSGDDLAFMPVSELAALVRTRQVSSLELAKLYLERLRKYDPVLKCVINYTEELALRQAKAADAEIAAGRYRGPLHGIPWGAKDLIAYPGYKTTWGALPFKDQTFPVKATVADRLEKAGAVLVAKLSLGALAQGDQWFNQMTRNPWNPRQGSSGSSAGSACATAAGLVGFAIGSETLGSIVSPSTRCGTTGLRPTYGRVSRYGCMTLAWSMDKLGPLCRSVEDCALVLGAIHGFDGLDGAAVDRPFDWPCRRELRSLRVGYFEAGPVDKRPDLQVLKDLGVQLVPIKLPQTPSANPLTLILDVEAAAAFDEITRKHITEGLNSWPQTFRKGQFIPAVDYLRANRIRTQLMHVMRKVMQQVDLYVGGDDLVITNLTGHPTVVLPTGFAKGKDGEAPYSITFTGRLYGETELLAVAHAYQQATGHHLRRPNMEKLIADKPPPADEEEDFDDE